MESKYNLFKWKHYESEITLLTVRWYLKYSLSYRDVVKMMIERGLTISHTTIMRWVHEFGPEIDKRICPYLKHRNDSYRVDETYIKVKGQWNYLYSAVDLNHLDCATVRRTRKGQAEYHEATEKLAFF